MAAVKYLVDSRWSWTKVRLIKVEYKGIGSLDADTTFHGETLMVIIIIFCNNCFI